MKNKDVLVGMLKKSKKIKIKIKNIAEVTVGEPLVSS